MEEEKKKKEEEKIQQELKRHLQEKENQEKEALRL